LAIGAVLQPASKNNKNTVDRFMVARPLRAESTLVNGKRPPGMALFKRVLGFIQNSFDFAAKRRKNRITRFLSFPFCVLRVFSRQRRLHPSPD
jgi:hypothetical protein